MTPNKNVRELLLAIGMGGFNATMAIPTMMIAPATTDPKSVQVILIVQHLQKALYGLGATDVALGGRLDVATANALEQVVGPDWERRPWQANVSAVVNAMESGARITPSTQPSVMMAPIAVGAATMAVDGPLDFLPDVPGGLFTYAVGAYLLYRHLTKKGRAS